MTEPHRDEIAKLEALHGEHPEGRVFTHLAEAYRKAGEHGRALETIEAGLVRHSEYASAHVVRGRVLLDLGQKEGAAAAFRNVLELDRHNLIALRALGELAREGGRTDEALGYFRELLTIDPADPELSAEVGRLEAAVAAEPVAAEPGGLAEQAPGERVEAVVAEPVAETADEPAVAGDGSAADFGEDDAPPVDAIWPMGAAEAGAEGERDESEVRAAGTETGEGMDPTEASTPAQEDEGDGYLTLDSIRLSESESESTESAAEDRPWPDSWWSGEASRDEATETQAEPSLTAPSESEDADVEPTSDFHWTFPGWGEEEEAVEVRTETMAALYASQGLWGRAAEIYRGLLAERPGDAGLEERLRAAEARIEEGIESGRSAQDEAGPASEQWLEGVESAWTGGQGVVGASASPYDWEEDAEDAAPGPTVGEYLRSLAEWRPGGEAAVEGAPEDGPADADEGEAALREWLAEEPTEPEPLPGSDWPPPSAVEPSGEQPEGEEDEDVEMFRTWLQSLRK